MKLLYITGSLPPLRCGIGFYSDRLLPELAKKASVSVLTTEGMKPTAEIKTIHTPNWRLFSLPKLYKHCASQSFDTFIIQYPARGYGRQIGINILPFLIRYKMKKPVTVMLHEYHGSGLLGKLRNLLTVLFANRVLVSNEYDLRALPRKIRKKTTIVPIGSNIDVYSTGSDVFDRLVSENGLSTKKMIGAFLGFPNPNKGMDLLIESVSAADAQAIILAGIDKHNPYQVRLQDKIYRLKKRGAKIVLAGYLDDKDVSGVLQRVDYFVLPQPLPLTAKSGTALAAAVHKLPIISTGASDRSLNEPYVHNHNAILLNPMNSETLTKTLKELDRDEELLQTIRKNLGPLASQFSWEHISDMYLQVLKGKL